VTIGSKHSGSNPLLTSILLVEIHNLFDPNPVINFNDIADKDTLKLTNLSVPANPANMTRMSEIVTLA
jgi:hypothetical protein